MEASTAHMTHPVSEELPTGTMLSGDQFTITGRLGSGGFGITYRAEDNVLGRTIVIKECFPEDFCYRDGKIVVPRAKSHEEPVRSIVRMFMREAQSLAKLRHPNIVGVHRAFEENETAYMVLDLIDGHDLLDIVEAQARPLPPSQVKHILVQMLDAIEKVHELDLLHRDISPDNIIIEKSGTPVLIDFGAARSDASRRTRAVTSMMMVKDGYSPQEFYVAGSMQTPSSDLYALAATFYHVLSGEAPVNSQARMIEVAGNKPDPCAPLAGRIDGYERGFLEAIDAAMKVHPSERLQTVAEWRALISDIVRDAKENETAIEMPVKQQPDQELEKSLTRLVQETNAEVRKSKELPIEPEVAAPLQPRKKTVPEWIKEFNKESLELSAAEAQTVATPSEVNVDDPSGVVVPDIEDVTRTRIEYVIAQDVHAAERVDHALDQQYYAHPAPSAVPQRPISAPPPPLMHPVADQPAAMVIDVEQASPQQDLLRPLTQYLVIGMFAGLVVFLAIGLLLPYLLSVF